MIPSLENDKSFLYKELIHTIKNFSYEKPKRKILYNKMKMQIKIKFRVISSIQTLTTKLLSFVLMLKKYIPIERIIEKEREKKKMVLNFLNISFKMV